MQGAGQGHRSRVRGGVYFGASALYITGVRDAYSGRVAGVGNLAPGSCAEWVYVSTVCVRACVCAWGGVSAPEPVGCAGWEEEAREVPPAGLCSQETLEGTGKGNGRPEGWEVARVPV